MGYQDQLLDVTNRHLLEQMLQDYREGKETDERLATMLRTYADGLAEVGKLSLLKPRSGQGGTVPHFLGKLSSRR